MKSYKRTNLLQRSVEQAVFDYLTDLDGEAPCNLFETVVSEIERPLLQTVLSHCRYNQTKTAAYLGINRSTLRKKLKLYQIEH